MPRSWRASCPSYITCKRLCAVDPDLPGPPNFLVETGLGDWL